MSNLTTSSKVLVLSPSHKCGIDFKVRGVLSERKVTTMASGETRIRVGNLRLPVTVSSYPYAPVRCIIPASASLPGCSAPRPLRRSRG